VGQKGAWDSSGNPGLRLEFMPGVLHGYNFQFAHDALGRQTGEQDGYCCGGLIFNRNYGYDAAGNRTSRVKDGVTVTYTYDNNDKLTSASDGSSFGYDGNGNLTSVSGPLGAWSFVYNDANQLVSVTSPGSTDTYLCNALGKRMRMCRGTVGGLTWRFVYNGDRVLELTDDANTPLVRYATENGSYYSPYLRANIIGNWCSGASIRYPIYDGGGNFTWLVDVNGGICDHNQWDAFGLIFSDPSPQNYSWGGAWGYMEERPGSGLVQMGARWYWPEIGRFVQQDRLRVPNRYVYGLDNPVRWVDPSGLWCFTLEGYFPMLFGFGPGGSVGVGHNPGGGWFLKFHTGVGTGGGYALHPRETTPDWNANGPRPPSPGLGAYAGASANLGGAGGPLSLSIGPGGGGGWDPGRGWFGYGGLNPDYGYSPDVNFRLKASINIGIDIGVY